MIEQTDFGLLARRLGYVYYLKNKYQIAERPMQPMDGEFSARKSTMKRKEVLK
ncbi:hypothetical protein [Telluribacter sp. SYSU D00476]|uniref:hypothetical protein n=1 Tax=Telluribacter sp. SYSU D00476 TaxID=2811430 RepID=UPI001FF2F21C|nr:hypothetical protein [Telluribacter sp. SYSU D00476]